MHALVVDIYLNTKFELPSFTDHKDVIGACRKASERLRCQQQPRLFTTRPI